MKWGYTQANWNTKIHAFYNLKYTLALFQFPNKCREYLKEDPFEFIYKKTSSAKTLSPQFKEFYAK